MALLFPSPNYAPVCSRGSIRGDVSAHSECFSHLHCDVLACSVHADGVLELSKGDFDVRKAVLWASSGNLLPFLPIEN